LPDATLVIPRVSRGRWSWLLLLLVATISVSVVGVAQPADVAAKPPTQGDQLRFMWAMAQQESGADYYARNTASGAFGKYQIMPFNWSAWAAEYLGDGRADQTPYNQEKVAYGKLRDLYGWLGSWKRVAYWWLTGRSENNERRWSGYAKGYVTNIMRLRKRAPSSGRAMPQRTTSRASPGDWRRSGVKQKLRLSVAGRAWSRKGSVDDGEVLKVVRAKRTRGGERWIEVVTVNGRLGWLKQLSTVPARRPKAPRRWNDVRTSGDRGAVSDRSGVRPRPR
jgi:hypothetical protein